MATIIRDSAQAARSKRNVTRNVQALKRLDLAVQTRNFEIELFWKRSLFFWGFIAAAFAGYAALQLANPNLATSVACFGMVCSFCWALVTRGSKYWQENWETKVDECEGAVIGRFFAVETAVQTHKGRWLQSRRYSVSKISMALSDYVFLMWIGLITNDALVRFGSDDLKVLLKQWGPVAFIVLSLLFMSLLVFVSRTSKRPVTAVSEPTVLP